MNRARIFQAASVTGLLLIAGCLSSENRRSVAIDHPANPQAQEAPFTPPRDLLAEPVSPSLANPPVQKEVEVYTCPMHPDVREPTPGKCPKCGMTLEAAAPTEKHGGEHVHEAENGR